MIHGASQKKDHVATANGSIGRGWDGEIVTILSGSRIRAIAGSKRFGGANTEIAAGSRRRLETSHAHVASAGRARAGCESSVRSTSPAPFACQTSRHERNSASRSGCRVGNSAIHFRLASRLEHDQVVIGA